MKKNIFLLKYLAEKVKLQKAGGQLDRITSTLAKSTIDLNPHQIYAAISAFNSPLSRGAIFADEVGLGKTIEAGIVMAQLILEDRGRILIVAPASLRTQWKEELEVHFGIESTVVDTPYLRKQVKAGEPTPMTEDGVYIASLPFVYNNIGLVEKQPWDLVVVDEAHRLRNVYKGQEKSKMAFALREALKKTPKLLLTATPLQNNLMELYGLVSFIDPKLLGGKYYFKSRFVDNIRERPSASNPRLKELKRLLTCTPENNYKNPTGIVVRTLREQVSSYIQFSPRTSFTQDFEPNPKEKKLYDFVSNYLSRGDIAAINTSHRTLMTIIYRKLLASSTFAIAPSLKKLYKRLEKELEIRKLEEEKGFEFKKEKINTLFEEDLEEDELEQLEEIESFERVDDYFTDEEIREEIEELKEYYNLAISIDDNAKGEALINALKQIFEKAGDKGWPRKAVIFTESTRTQNYIKGKLLENDISCTPFNGSNNSNYAKEVYNKWKKEFPKAADELSKDVAIRQALVWDFKNNTEVFLTTEAGSQGLNLQFANIIINYDLPWNPQRVEQRIGRCHRYGQKHEVVVANMLNSSNKADKRVLELLKDKFKLFDGVFGASDEILGALESGLDFEKKILNIYQSCKTPVEIEEAFNELQEEMDFVLEKSTKKIRTKLFENFDTSVAQLFKKTKKEAEKSLNSYDNDLLKLCKTYFGKNNVKKIGEAKYKIDSEDLKEENFLFREENDEEVGKISRIHSDHHIVKKILADVKTKETSPIPTTIFNLNEDLQDIKGVNDFKNKEGFIYLFKIIVEGVETDEMLIPLAFIENEGNYDIISVDKIKYVIENFDSHTVDEKVDKSPIPKNQLLNVWKKWKEDSLKKYQERNENLYEREEKRIERYWESQTFEEQDEIEKLKHELDELKRKKNNTIDFDEKRKYSEKLQKKENKLKDLKIEKAKNEADYLDMKRQDLDKLNNDLDLNVDDKLIAVTRFIIK